jgi:hypothetical protein
LLPPLAREGAPAIREPTPVVQILPAHARGEDGVELVVEDRKHEDVDRGAALIGLHRILHGGLRHRELRDRLLHDGGARVRPSVPLRSARSRLPGAGGHEGSTPVYPPAAGMRRGPASDPGPGPGEEPPVTRGRLPYAPRLHPHPAVIHPHPAVIHPHPAVIHPHARFP